MPVTQPYRRNRRPFTNGDYKGPSMDYVRHPKYSFSPGHYIRAANLIKKDLLELFDFVEPADQNLKTYSFRIHELLLRTCVEVEANCKAILLENGYHKVKTIDLTMRNYYEIEKS